MGSHAAQGEPPMVSGKHSGWERIDITNLRMPMIHDCCDNIGLDHPSYPLSYMSGPSDEVLY